MTVTDMIDQLNILAVATKQVKNVVEATPSIAPVINNVVATTIRKTSTPSAFVSDVIYSLPFYLLNLFFLGYLVLLWALMYNWVGSDCGKRGITGMRKRNFQVLTLIFNFPGLLLYLLFRPQFTLDDVRRAQMEEEVLSLELQKLRRESANPPTERKDTPTNTFLG